MALAALAAGTRSLPAQVRGIPVYNAGVARGFGIYADVGFPNDGRAAGTPMPSRARPASASSASPAHWPATTPMAPMRASSVGATINYRIFGGPLVPLAVNLQGGIGYYYAGYRQPVRLLTPSSTSRWASASRSRFRIPSSPSSPGSLRGSTSCAPRSADGGDERHPDRLRAERRHRAQHPERIRPARHLRRRLRRWWYARCLRHRRALHLQSARPVSAPRRALPALLLALLLGAARRPSTPPRWASPPRSPPPAISRRRATASGSAAKSVFGFWGLVKYKEPSLRKALAAQLAGGSGVADLRIRVRSRWTDVLITGLTLGPASSRGR